MKRIIENEKTYRTVSSVGPIQDNLFIESVHILKKHLFDISYIDSDTIIKKLNCNFFWIVQSFFIGNLLLYLTFKRKIYTLFFV